jgi:hypothetical protein
VVWSKTEVRKEGEKEMAIIVIIVMYALAGLCFVLGMIALLKQKTYIDAETQQPTEVEIPIIGKLKTNYPALVFVVIGGFLAAIPWYKECPVKTDVGKQSWIITGAFLPPPGGNLKMEEGVLTLSPKDFETIPFPNGTFRITGNIQKDKKIEDVVDSICYTNGNFSGFIVLSNEYNKFKSGKPSLIETAGERNRNYKPFVLTGFAPP